MQSSCKHQDAECLDQAFVGSAQNPALTAPRRLFTDTIAVCWGHVKITKPGNTAYGVLCGIKWELCLRPTSRVTKGQVQVTVNCKCCFMMALSVLLRRCCALNLKCFVSVTT